MTQSGFKLHNPAHKCGSHQFEHRHIFFFHIVPQCLFFSQMLWCAGFDTQNCGYTGNHSKIFYHIVTAFFIFQLCQIAAVNHQFIYTNLLVHTANHNFFVYGLVFTAYKIAVKVCVHIIK